MNDILIGKIASAVQLQGSVSGEEQLQGFISGKEQLKGSFELFTLPEHQYEGSYTVTPTESEQVLPTSGRTPLGNIKVDPIPEQYIVPSGTITITENGTEDVTQYASASVDVQPSLQAKSVTISKAGNTDITADEGYYGLSTATAFVPSGEASQGTQFGYTSSGTRWRMRGYNNVTSAGWFESGQTQGTWASFYAVPSGTVITPTESSQTVGGNDYMMQGAVTVSPIPSQYIVPSGTLSISANGTENVTQYSSVDVNVPDNALVVTLTYKNEYDSASGSYIDMWCPNKTCEECFDAVADGMELVVEVDKDSYYDQTGVHPYSVTATIELDNYGGAVLYDVITVLENPDRSIWQHYFLTFLDELWLQTEGHYIMPYGTITISASGDTDVTSYATASVPSASVSLTRTTYFITENGQRKWVIEPKASATTSGWFGGSTSTEFKYPALSNVTITPTESTQTVGDYEYVLQNAITVSPIPSQYIVPSGTISISSNGTVDVTQYASASISVPTPSPTLQTKTFTVSSYGTASVSADAGYDGLSKVTITTPSGSATVPDVSQTSATVTTGTNTLTLTKTVSLTPTVSAGYISSGTARNASIKLTGTVTTQSASTYYPSTADQTITSRYLTGTQTFKGVTTSNLSASNIKSGVTVMVGDTADADRIASVTGTLSFVTYYTGSSTPSSSLGNNGDIYLQE